MAQHFSASHKVNRAHFICATTKTKSTDAILSNKMAVLYWLGAILLASYATVTKADEEEFTMALDDLVDALEPFGERCDSPPERDHIVELVQNVEDAKMGTKCFRQCMLEQFDIMPTGTFRFEEDKVVDMLGMMYPDKEEKSRDIVRLCNEKHGKETEKCEAAHVLSMCMLHEMRAHEYKIPEIKR